MSEHIPNAIDMRRSQRVLLRVATQVRWTPPGETAITEDTVTLVVNAHGALILLAMKVKAGSRIFVRNSAVTQDKECRVVRVQGRGSSRKGLIRPRGMGSGAGQIRKSAPVRGAAALAL